MKFMVSAVFNHPSPEMAALVPAEQARVKELHEEGTLEAIYIEADRRKVWLIMIGDNEEQVQANLATLPLHPYMEIEIAPLQA